MGGEGIAAFGTGGCGGKHGDVVCLGALLGDCGHNLGGLSGSGSGWNAKILGDRSLALDRDKNLHASRERLVPIPYAWWVYGGVFPVRMLDPS